MDVNTAPEPDACLQYVDDDNDQHSSEEHKHN